MRGNEMKTSQYLMVCINYHKDAKFNREKESESTSIIKLIKNGSKQFLFATRR